MKNALGSVQSVLTLGATSDIARATGLALGRAGARRFVLAARDTGAATQAATELLAAGASSAIVERFDAEELAGHEPLLDAAFATGDIDLVLVAFGVLCDQDEALRDPAVAVRTATVNYVAAISLLSGAARRLQQQGHGTIVVLSSVAAQRPRKSNFLYGSSKAGLDAFAQGLGDALAPNGIRVLVVRPGFVHTKMTAGLPPAPLSTTPERVADAIVSALARGAETVWVPPSLRLVMAVLCHLPRSVFRRLPL
ncbi:MAG: decaprenylphospho-beta-D-erythro-pentofuranosid-2-ulose 2-reductase [Solirubrobacteraceae bacterium]